MFSGYTSARAGGWANKGSNYIAWPTSLNDLALLDDNQGRYAKGEPLYGLETA